MEDAIKITTLNDFIFCPISVYFHNLYYDLDKSIYQGKDQINGTDAHKNIDNSTYRTSEKAITGLEVYCEKYNLIGKIDTYYPESKRLVERKKLIKNIYDGYVFQLYGQYFSLVEMGYEVKSLAFYSLDDNKKYFVPLPQDNAAMLEKFERVIEDINSFDIFDFKQTNSQKCNRCIYEPMCDRSVKNDVML